MTIDDIDRQRAEFYAQRAVAHGGMARYYVEQIHALTLTPPAHECEIDWPLTNAPIEAREAWHYASMLSDREVAIEQERQAERDRQDARLEF
jgi:hypothetical protein